MSGRDYRRFAVAGRRGRDGPTWQYDLQFRMYSKGNVYVDDFEGIHWIRPKLGISNASPIDLGEVPMGRGKDCPPRAITNSQVRTAGDGAAPVATVLYGACNITIPGEEKDYWKQTSDDVGAEMIGPDAGLFEFVTDHPGKTARQLRLVGPDGQPGLLGGPGAESEKLVVRFLGSPRAGAFHAAVRICTEAGNVGALSAGKEGQPPANLFYVDIPVQVVVAGPAAAAQPPGRPR